MRAWSRGRTPRTTGWRPGRSTSSRSTTPTWPRTRTPAVPTSTRPEIPWRSGTEPTRSDPVGVPPLQDPPGVAHGQRDDRLHRVDAGRAGEQAGVGHDQPGHAVELPEAAGHAAPRVRAH